MLFRILRIGSSLFKSNYLKNEKVFLSFLFHLWNLHEVLNIFKTRQIVRADVFPNFQTVKDLVRPLSKKCSFRTPFDSQHVKVSQTLVKSAWEQFYQIFPSLWGKIIWKISPLSKFEISGHFLHTWLPMTSMLFRLLKTCGSLFKCNYLKKKNFSLNFLFNLWNLHQISNIFWEKNFVIPNVFPKLQTVKELVRPLSKKGRFRTFFDSQLVKWSFSTCKICMGEPLSYFSITLRGNYS